MQILFTSNVLHVRPNNDQVKEMCKKKNQYRENLLMDQCEMLDH